MTEIELVVLIVVLLALFDRIAYKRWYDKENDDG